MKTIKWEKWQDFFNSDQDGASKIVIPTPMGMVSHKISADCSGNLNFWVGNTNFDLDDIHIAILKDVHGVEILNVWTPYKFRICIGKNFDTKKVKRSVEEACGCVKVANRVNLTETKKQEIKFVKSIISKNKFWAIYVLPNGEFESCHTNNNDEFSEKFSFYKSIEQAIGGLLLSPTKDKMVY